MPQQGFIIYWALMIDPEHLLRRQSTNIRQTDLFGGLRQFFFHKKGAINLIGEWCQFRRMMMGLIRCQVVIILNFRVYISTYYN